MTAARQRMIGLGVAANETVNRVFYLIGVDLSNIGDLGELRFSQHTFALRCLDSGSLYSSVSSVVDKCP